MSKGFSFQTGQKRSLEVLDYVLFSLLFVVSSAVGFYHAYRWRTRTTEVEFHFAGRSVHPVPVGMSMVATLVSSITILGVPAEIYTNNTMHMWTIVAACISTILVAHVFAPFFFSLNVTSIYEYIEMRFSRSLRLAASAMFVLQYIIYLGIVLYLPCLALQAVTDVSLWYTMVVVCVVCTLFTIMGGMRGDIRLDTIHLLVIIAGLVAAFIGGLDSTGGIRNAWEIAKKDGRIQFDELSPDPRTRHSVWSIAIGYTAFLTYNYGLTQLQIQRICTLSATREVKVAVWLNLPFYLVVQTMVCLTGVVMFAFYSSCHPLSAGLINKNDQLMPLFVLDVLGQIPGMPGLFIASVFSGSLSTLSSCLNTISTSILEDFIKPFCCLNFTSRHGVLITRLLILVLGCCMFLISILASAMTQLIVQFATSLYSMLIGPLMGLFVCGMFLPWTNSKGATAGLLVSFMFMVWLVVGTIVENPAGRRPLPTRTDGCFLINALENTTAHNRTTHTFIHTTTYLQNNTPNTTTYLPKSKFKMFETTTSHAEFTTTYMLVHTTTQTPYTRTKLIKEASKPNNESDTTTMSMVQDEPMLHNFYRISYMWYGLLGTIINITVTLIVSFLTGFTDPTTIESRLICPIFDRLCPWLPETIRRPLRFGIVYDTNNDVDIKDQNKNAESVPSQITRL